MTWLVVHFIGDESVEYVPDVWYIEKTNECFWPPRKITKAKMQLAIKSKSMPDSDWHAYPARILGKCDNLEDARKRVKKAEYSSNLSSCDGEVRPRRIPKKNMKYRHTSSSSGPESSDSSEYPRFGKSGLNNISRDDADAGDKKTKNKSEIPTQEIHKEGGPSIQSSSCRVQVSELIPENATAVQPTFNQPLVIPDSNEFRTSVLRELNLINSKLNSLIESMHLVLNFNDKRMVGTKSKFIEEVLPKFPVSEEALQQIELDLAKDQNMEILALELSHVGGVTVKDGTRKLMYKLFTNEVGVKYSWEGAKGKSPFKHLYLAKVIIRSVRLMFPMSTELEIIAVIKLWLVRAKDRMEKAPKEPDENNDGGNNNEI